MTDQTPLEAVHQLGALARELEETLRRQQAVLQLREMGLPENAFEDLATLHRAIEDIQPVLVAEQTELSQLQTLMNTLEQINSSLDLDAVLKDAMDRVVALTGAERGYIVLTRPFSNDLEFHICHDPEQLEKFGTTTFQGSRTILQEVLQSGEAILADNAYKDPRMQNSTTIASLTLRSVLCVPLQLKERVIGAVYVDNRMRSGVFTVREKTLLTAFANQATIAIDNARLFTQVQNRLAAITELNALIESVFTSIGSGVITTDSDLMITTYNRAAEQILKYQQQGALGKSIKALFPRINIDLTQYLHETLTEGRNILLETEFDSPKHGHQALGLKLSPLKAQQKIQGVAIVVDDLTNQRQDEETLQLMRRYLSAEMVDNIETIATIDLGGERREITCMFVDVRPLSSFPRSLSPQQIMEMLNAHLTVASDCIQAQNGVVDKFMGHEVMALFNSQLNPQAHHARLAVEAALAIRDAFIKMYAENGENPNPHYYRIGIHTGIATLGNVGSLNRRDFTALGDTINLAKRLEENTLGGQIIISEDTLNHLKQAPQPLHPLRLEACSPIQVKGRQQQTLIYEVFRK